MTEKPEYPKTALITGASSGLGAEFARQLAAQGYHLVLTARRTQRLEELSAELQSRHGIGVTTLTADLSHEAGIAQIETYIANLPGLSLLINNAGFDRPGPFYQVKPGDIDDVIQVHVTATVRLTRAALPAMLNQGQGGVINVGSIAGLLPLRGTLYCTTKAFIITFSESLARELKGLGVQVQALCPGFTFTEFHDTPEYVAASSFKRSRIPSFMWLTAEQVVRTSLADLQRRRVLSVPGMQYRIIAGLARNSFTYGLIKILANLRFKNQ
ncbi:MAG TPA: SDR family oxidoreductase [Anaerolineales bacterium]|nr:SDR family oxidoreductase [Anaerolineales bacterium]